MRNVTLTLSEGGQIIFQGSFNDLLEQEKGRKKRESERQEAQKRAEESRLAQLLREALR